MKGQKRCYLGALLLKMKELALKCAGKQKQEFQVFIMRFKAWGDCEQSEEQGTMWSINMWQYQTTAVRPLQNKESTFWTSKYAKKTHPPRASHISGWKRLLGSIKEYLQDFPFSVATLMKYFDGILSVVILNIVTGPGASVAGSSKSFQPGDRRNLCSPAKHLHTHILTFAVQGFILDDRD